MTQLPEFSTNPYENKFTRYDDPLNIRVRNQHMEYIRRKIKHENPRILDMGARNPLTERLTELTRQTVISTIGDLDDGFTAFNTIKFDVVVYSHTMEHQFNPLYTLLRLKQYIAKDAQVFILLPSRGKLLWDKTHFHEIDDYRFRMLCKRAGMQVISSEKKHCFRQWWFYLTGVRPFLRLFFERMIYYECKYL